MHPEFRDATPGFDILQPVRVFLRRHRELSDVAMLRRFEGHSRRDVFSEVLFTGQSGSPLDLLGGPLIITFLIWSKLPRLRLNLPVNCSEERC